MIKADYIPTNLLGDQDGWLVESRTFDPAGSGTIDLIQPGAIVKLDPATGKILAYLAADATAVPPAAPHGIVIRKADMDRGETNLSISIRGVFDENSVGYWDPAAVAPALPFTPVAGAANAAAIEAALKAVDIYLRPAIKSGAYAP
jgi:hypothetical protein